MKKYLIIIEDKDSLEWTKFAKLYKRKNLGNNIGEAILALIKKENDKRE